jgi:predicted 2-oxoglutarate/Fe(II)-dependent dioxygenase YbiX
MPLRFAVPRSADEPGMAYGPHVDRPMMGSSAPFAAMFPLPSLSAPDEYDGGELIVESPAGTVDQAAAGVLSTPPTPCTR